MDGLAGLAGGVEEVAAAGGVAAVCASAPCTKERQPDERPRNPNPQHHATEPDTIKGALHAARIVVHYSH